jgi:hypothetical protein
VHEKFWDGVNFNKGANPPREEWKAPPQKSEADSKLAYETFFSYIRFIKRFPEVQFITAREAAELYKDKALARRFDMSDFRKIAEQVGDEVNFQRHGDFALAPSELFALLNEGFRQLTHNDNEFGIDIAATPRGPTGQPPAMTEPVTTTLNQFIRSSADAHDYLQKHGRVPSAVWLGSTPVTPEAYLVALAKLVVLVTNGKPFPEKIELKPAKLATAKYVADDDPRLWGWIIFPPGFRAPAMMELARKQAWTIKPAILHRP